ncbi:MAG: MxaS protein [Burkholderiaceae bacterium]|nr:MxaS protein [Burkholderiaceae bacterium]
MKPIREVHYRIAGAAAGLFPGAHRSRSGDGGFEFRGHAALHDAPDARRLDLHASLRDPLGGWMVRLSSERRSIPVALVADLSASMGFEGTLRKLDVLADFTASLAWSAARNGDSFGFVGCDERVREDLLLPQTRRRGAGLALAAALRSLRLSGRSARGLHDAHRHLPARRALLFLLSDFHLPLAEVARVLAGLAAHDVVPVVLWQPEEFALSAPHALAQVQEPESGERRWLWWRPALRERWRAAHAARRAALLQLFLAQRLAPLWIEGAFDADAVTRHFMR